MLVSPKIKLLHDFLKCNRAVMVTDGAIRDNRSASITFQQPFDNQIPLPLRRFHLAGIVLLAIKS
jgi:hypothetical protein